VTITEIRDIVCFEWWLFRIIGKGIGDWVGSKPLVSFLVTVVLTIPFESLVEFEAIIPAGTVVELETTGWGFSLGSGRRVMGDVKTIASGSAAGLGYLPIQA
jgi:hypothetical protein